MNKRASFSQQLTSRVRTILTTGFLLFISLEAFSVEISQDEMKLRAEQWELGRNGEYLLQIPVLKKVVNEWLLKEDYRIELRYPGGEEGELWVGELKDWLISLGIPSEYLVAVPGSGQADIIVFKIIKAGDSYR